MCFFRKRREKKRALQEEQLKMQQESMKKESIAEEKPTPAPTVTPLEPSPKVVPTLEVEEKVVEPKKEVKPKPVKEEKKPEAAQKTSTANAKYHVSQNKDAKSNYFKQWRVRKEGSSKTIKYFETQAEAIEFAEDLAEKSDTTVVIHKLDGSIRKQDYQKKD